MELHLKINDVVGMDDEKRHIIRVDDESLRRALMEHPKWMTQCVVKEWLMKNPSLLSEIIEDNDLRNTIYNQEKERRKEKDEKKRREEAHRASIATRKALDFYHDILGI